MLKFLKFYFNLLNFYFILKISIENENCLEKFQNLSIHYKDSNRIQFFMNKIEETESYVYGNIYVKLKTLNETNNLAYSQYTTANFYKYICNSLGYDNLHFNAHVCFHKYFSPKSEFFYNLMLYCGINFFISLLQHQ